MRKVTATEKYRAVNEGQMPQAEFVRQMRLAFPQHITQFNGYEDTVSILKTRGILSETKLAKQLPNTVSIDSIQRAVDIELEAMGHDPVTCSDVEAQDKAKDKALKNLKKDPLHYYNLLAKESSKVDKNDKMKETKPGAKDKDTFNDMKKATLKEEMAVFSSEEDEDKYIEKMVKKGLEKEKEKAAKKKKGVEEAHDIPTEPGVPGERASNHDRKMAMRKILDFLTVNGHPDSGHKVSTQDAVDFIKTHKDDIFSGDIDASNIEDVWHNYDEYETINRDNVGEVMGVNRKGEKQPETDGSSAAKYKRAAKGMKEAYKPGDMYSSDFDYAGMLKAGLMIPEPKGQPSGEEIEHMMRISDSFEDVNYHTENGYLQHAIDAFQHEDEAAGLESLKQFKQIVAKTAKSIMQEGGSFVREDEKEYLEKRDKAIKKAMGKEEEETVDEGFNDHLSAEDLSDLAQFFYSYAISTEMDGYTDVAKHIDQAARQLGNIEAPDKGPGMKEAEAVVKEGRGVMASIKDAVEELMFDGDISEKEAAMELVIAISDEYGFDLAGNEFDIFHKGMSEKKGKDHDGDGDVDSDDYMAAKDKAIKKAMNENIKAIVAKVLEEGVVNEAATAELSRIADDYAGFDGMKSAIIALENIVTDIEQYYEKTRTKIQKVYDTLGEIRNEEGLKVGGFIAPAIEQAFLKDLRPVTKTGFTKGLDQPKVRTISQADIDAHNSGERPLGEEAPKETVFTPVMETKKKK